MRAALACAVVVSLSLACGGLSQPAPVHREDLAALLAENAENPAGVVAKHRGADVELTGYVHEVNHNNHNDTFLHVSPNPRRDFDAPELLVYVPDEALVLRLGGYPVGSQITLRVALDQAPSIHLVARCVAIVGE
jgi:hypothetical protein